MDPDIILDIEPTTDPAMDLDIDFYQLSTWLPILLANEPECTPAAAETLTKTNIVNAAS